MATLEELLGADEPLAPRPTSGKKTEEAAPNTMGDTLSQRYMEQLGVIANNEEARNSNFGPTDTYLTGTSSNEAKDSGFEQFFSGVVYPLLKGENFSKGRSAKDFILAKDFLEGYDAVRGAGQITEYEGKTAAQVQSFFGNPSLTQDDAQREAQRIISQFELSDARKVQGIQIGPDNVEYKTDENGDKTNVVSFKNPETGQIEIVETGDRKIYTVHDFVTDEAAERLIKSLPVGQEYVRNGKIQIKKQNPKTEKKK